MRTHTFLGAIGAGVVGVLIAAGVAMGAVADEVPKPAVAIEVRPDYLLVRMVAGVTADQVRDLDKKAGAVEVTWVSTLVPGLRCVRVAAGTGDAARAAYRGDAIVMYAELDVVRRMCAQSVPYGVTMVQAPLAWPISRGTGVIVADLDTGMDLVHPDLPVPALAETFVGQAVQDLHGHGTHTAGTIVAVDNTDGVVGVAPSATLIVGKVLGNGGGGSDASVAAGIDWAVQNGARVISMSLGSSGDNQALHDSCDAALAAGALVVAAAGNGNTSDLFYPADYPSVLAVAAIDSNMQRASFSNFGPAISLAAPGVGVLSTYIGGTAVWGGVSHTALPLSGSADGTVSGNAVYCGIGDTAAAFPPEVTGQIAHIRRGDITFQLKVQNAIDAGAIGVIVSNNVPGLFSGTLQQSFPIPVVGISQADGDALQALALAGPTQATISPTGEHTYGSLSGTSMACPHVAGVAAVLFGAVPGATPAQVRAAMEQTALDLGDAGRDDLYGHGLVRADLAVQYLRDHYPCGADFNYSGVVNVQDIFEFLAAWFAGDPRADFDHAGGNTVTDVFGFLGAWFRGCP